MILASSREQEVRDRAVHRSVTAFVSMEIPGQDPHLSPGHYGVIVEPHKSLRAGTLLDKALDQAFARAATCWMFEDTCSPLVERDSSVLKKSIGIITRRMEALSAIGAANLSRDEKKSLFDSADVIDAATGIEPKLTYDFGAGVITSGQINQIPFPKVKDFISQLFCKLSSMNGCIRSVAIRHTTAMSAFEYYEMALNPHIQGKRFSYGEVMLSRANNALVEVGMPLVYPPKHAGLH